MIEFEKVTQTDDSKCSIVVKVQPSGARMDFQRKVMVFSVSVLGLSLSIFLLAYMVFGDNTDEDLRTLRQTNVSVLHSLALNLEFLLFLFI